MTKVTTDLTKYQAKSIGKWEFDMEEMKRIEPKDEIAKAALNKFINRNGAPIDVHRTNDRRVFSPFTAMKRTHRKFVSFQGSPLIEVDAANSHPLIMVHKMIQEGFDIEPDLKVAVESGTFYDYLMTTDKTRSEVKESWFSFCYSKQLNVRHPVYIKLNKLFPVFMKSFADYSKGRNLSEYLQELESRIWIDKISMALMRAGLHHITIHDSVVFAGVQNINKVLDIVQAAFGSIDPPLHVEYLTDEKIEYKRVPNPLNSKYLNADFELIDELHKCIADPWKSIEKPETAVEMIDGDNTFALMTTGNFSAISGKSKSGKTLLISAIVASALSGGMVLNKFRGCLPETKRNIVYIDTEMADYDLQWVMKRVLKMAEVSKGDFLPITFYRLREKSTEKRNILIDFAIRTTKNVGLVIIDGIRDVVKDINNPEESTTAINNIMRWTDIYKLHLIAVLHQNPGKETGNKLRGHIGTEAMNKAEAVISVVNPDDMEASQVKGDFMRRDKFKAFTLSYNKATGLPEFISEEVEEVLHRVRNHWDITSDEHALIIDKLFKHRSFYPKVELYDKLKNLMLMMKYDVVRSTSEKLVKHWLNENIIIEYKSDKNKKLIKLYEAKKDMF